MNVALLIPSQIVGIRRYHVQADITPYQMQEQLNAIHINAQVRNVVHLIQRAQRCRAPPEQPKYPVLFYVKVQLVYLLNVVARILRVEHINVQAV